MRKWLVRLVVAVLLLVALAVFAVHKFLDAGIKKGVETVGPLLTKVDVKLDGVSVSLLSGSGSIKGLMIGNPEGFKSPSAIQVGKASLSLQPSSVMADKVIIKSINVQGPEVTFETDFKGNNLSKLMENVEAATGAFDPTPDTRAEAQSQRKLQVDDFRISGGKLKVSVTALGGRSVSVPLPEIRLTNLGQGPEGITAAELTKKVLRIIEQEAVKASAGAVTDLGNQAKDLVNDATKTATDSIKSVGGLFKKK